MIGFLRGKVDSIEGDVALMDVGGVGYEVLVSQNLLSTLQLGVTVQIPIYSHVREDAFLLFGFLNLQEKKMFLALNQINGIGPKMALKILAAAQLSELIGFIERGDVGSLSKLPRVGKKTAEQMVLALRGKMDLAAMQVDQGMLSIPMKDELVSALIHLGFKRFEVDQAVQKVGAELDLQAAIKESLQILSARPS